MEIKKIKKFSENNLKEIFSSVNWDSSKIPEILVQAFKNSSNVVSVWDNDKLVGIIRSMDDGFWSANIDCLVVHKDYQNKGIGKMLLNELLKDLKNVKYINICPDSKNMYEFYKSFDFKIIDGYYLQKTNF